MTDVNPQSNGGQPAPSIREGFVVMDDPSVPPMPKPEIGPAEAPEVSEPEVAAAAAAKLQLDKWPVKVKLMHKPIRDTKNNLINEVSFREPSARDIVTMGNPVRFDSNGDIITDEKKMTAVIAGLAMLFENDVLSMDPRDWNSCAYRLRPFFLPDPRGWL